MNVGNLPNVHAFLVQYKGPTEFKGSRVLITDLRSGRSIRSPLNHEYNKAEDQAVAYLTARGYELLGSAEHPKGTLILSSTFKPLNGLDAT